MSARRRRNTLNERLGFVLVVRVLGWRTDELFRKHAEMNKRITCRYMDDEILEAENKIEISVLMYCTCAIIHPSKIPFVRPYDSCVARACDMLLRDEDSIDIAAYLAA